MKLSVIVALTCIATLSVVADAQNIQPERLQEYLKQYPDADTDKDGTLSMAEARAYLSKVLGKKSAKPDAAATSAFPPTYADVHYGPHERNVLDFWKAKSDKPTAVVVFIHGGGFVAGDKSKAGGASRLNRFSMKAFRSLRSTIAIVQPPRYKTYCMIARAIQFLRSKSDEWNIDKTRFASHGGSAGAGTSLWLAFHDDMADPNHADPVLRESTRLVCACAGSTQFSYDILQWPQVLGEENTKKYGDSAEAAATFYGLQSDDELKGPIGQQLRADCDMLGMISKDDPPVFLSVSRNAGPIMNRGDLLHHPKHSQTIYDRCQALGVEVIGDIPGLDIKPPTDAPSKERDFMLKYLK